jgi:NAD(P)-dependent dehydrogenase (short-subunit alcohol dehydrogenase family)
MQTLNGKVAVITGGTRGLGMAIARGMAAEGAAVVLASRSSAAVTAAVADLRTQGYRAVGMALDVADLAQMEALAALARQEFGRVDIWVNNAGTAGPYGPTLDYAPEEFMRVVQTNIVGTYHGSRTAMRLFLAQGSGKLINIVGRGYDGPVPWQNAYASSKAWVRSFSLALASETKGSGVGVYAYNPGMVLTELLTDVDVIRGHEDKLKNFSTVVRLLAKSPDEAARGVVKLASAHSDGKTGLLVNNFSMFAVVGKLAEEGLATLRRRPVRSPEIRLTSVAPSEK